MTAEQSDPSTRVRRCPLCKKPAVAMHQPFCSKACKDRDLLQWLGEGYSVPGPPADRPDAEYD